MSAYGTSAYGTGALGLATAVSLPSISTAYATTTHAVRVVLTAEPQHRSREAAGDALNPASWSVARLDTGAALTVRHVVEVSPTAYEVVVAEGLGPRARQNRVTAAAVRSLLGALLGLPRTFDVPGLLANDRVTGAARAATRGHALRDLDSATTPRNPIGGTLVVTAAGDYGTVAGVELLKKLILRRLFTRPGEFFHLPAYGAGLRQKEPVGDSELLRLRKQIELQVAREPEVEAVKARVSIAAEGELDVTMSVRTRPEVGGAEFNLSGRSRVVQL